MQNKLLPGNSSLVKQLQSELGVNREPKSKQFRGGDEVLRHIEHKVWDCVPAVSVFSARTVFQLFPVSKEHMLPHESFSRKKKCKTLTIFSWECCTLFGGRSGSRVFQKGPRGRRMLSLLQGKVPCFTYLQGNCGDSCFDFPMANMLPWYHWRSLHFSTKESCLLAAQIAQWKQGTINQNTKTPISTCGSHINCWKNVTPWQYCFWGGGGIHKWCFVKLTYLLFFFFLPFWDQMARPCRV